MAPARPAAYRVHLRAESAHTGVRDRRRAPGRPLISVARATSVCGPTLRDPRLSAGRHRYEEHS